jgi:hypothetical protein
MDPFVLGIAAVVGASAAIAARLRRRAQAKKARLEAGSTPKKLAATKVSGTEDEPSPIEGVRVNDVLTYLGDEYWLSGELSLVRDGSAAMRLFSAPERGRERWVALPRDGRSIWVLYVDPDLASIGWPGVEVPSGERTLRRFEYGNAALVPLGEMASAWEGMGRFALFRALDAVAVVVEGPSKDRLALLGREIPRQLVQKMG